MKTVGILTALLCMLLLAGCEEEFPAETATQQTEDMITSMEAEPVLSYEVPKSVPGILVNQLGYTTGSSKVAVFRGREMPGQFYVKEESSQKIVYTGTLEIKKQDSVSKEVSCYGDFSAVISPGVYYIEAPILGRSYSFEIGEAVYAPLFDEACKQYYYNRCGMTLTEEYAGDGAHNACHTAKAVSQTDTSLTLDASGGWHQDEKGQKNMMTAARTVSTLLLAYELYPQVFSDNCGIPESGNGVPDILDEIKYEIDWMLKMQQQESGAVYAGVSVYAKSGDASSKAAEIYVEPISLDAGKAFAMALAKFSYLYQNYDTVYATNCLKAADRAWKYVELNENNKETDEWEFAAAAELYRASGQTSYSAHATRFLREKKYETVWNETTMLGCVTYLSTKHVVNTTYCENVMNYLMAKAEDISYVARDAVYFTAGTKEQDNDTQLLFEMMCLSVVNHIISNHEYETIIENHLHYFTGRNITAYNHISDPVGIMKQFESDAKLVVMLSGILYNGR